MKALRGAKPTRSPVWLVILLGTTSLLIAILALRPWVLEGYYLSRIPGADEETQWRYIEMLIERKCAAVVPHVLRYQAEFDERVRRDRDVSRRLVSLGPPAVPYLAEALETGCGDDLFVLSVLRDFGPEWLRALPAVVRYLEDHKWSRGISLSDAVALVGSAGERAGWAVPSLLRLVREGVNVDYGGMYEALGQMGPDAREAVPMIEEAIRIESGESRFRAIEALLRIEPAHEEIVPSLIDCLSDRSHYARWDAATALGGLGARAGAAIPHLLRSLGEDPKGAVAVACAEALDALAPEEGLRASVELARQEGKMSRLRGAWALGGFRSRANEVVPILLDLTRDRDGEIADTAVASLGRIGPAASAAVPRLLEICRAAESADTLKVAIRAFADIGVVSPEVLSTCVALVARGDPRLWVEIASLANKDPAVVEVLRQALDEDRETKIGALRVLDIIGPPAAAVAPDVERILQEADDERVASAARTALRGIRGR